MRTVTFSDPRVAKKVNERFVPAWYNRGTGFHNCNFWTEKNIFTRTADCFPTRNICTFFLTPDREVAYYIAGYYGPDAFLEILDVADSLKTIKSTDDRKEAHASIATSLSVRIRQVAKISVQAGESPEPSTLDRLIGNRALTYGDVTHEHQKECFRVLIRSLECRKRVHQQLTEGGFVTLKSVQHDYLFGNGFTEESKRSSIPILAKPRIPVKAAPAAGGR